MWFWGFFLGKTGDISPPGEVLSMDGKYPKILGPSSSQSPLRSGRPGVGIPRCAPLFVLSQPRLWVVVGFPGLRPYDFRPRGARLENGLNLFGAGMNLGPLCLPPAAARAGQIRRPLFSTLRLSCALPFRLRLLRSSHHVGPDALIGPRKSGSPQSPLIRPCGPPSPLSGEGFADVFYCLPPQGGSCRAKQD